jgi:hypothetical protein
MRLSLVVAFALVVVVGCTENVTVVQEALPADCQAALGAWQLADSNPRLTALSPGEQPSASCDEFLSRLPLSGGSSATLDENGRRWTERGDDGTSIAMNAVAHLRTDGVSGCIVTTEVTINNTISRRVITTHTVSATATAVTRFKLMMPDGNCEGAYDTTITR